MPAKGRIPALSLFSKLDKLFSGQTAQVMGIFPRALSCAPPPAFLKVPLPLTLLFHLLKVFPSSPPSFSLLPLPLSQGLFPFTFSMSFSFFLSSILCCCVCVFLNNFTNYFQEGKNSPLNLSVLFAQKTKDPSELERKGGKDSS